MKIILNQDVTNLGEEGDVVTVKNGYARNFLLPTKAAVLYTSGAVATVKARTAAIEKRKLQKRTLSSSVKEKLDAMTINLIVSAGESGKLFGSVTSAMVQTELSKQGVEIDRKKIEVATHAIKLTGTYQVRIHLYEDEFSLVKLVVESEAEVKARVAKAAAEAAKAAAEQAKAAKAAAKAAEDAAKVAAASSAEEVAPAQEATSVGEEAAPLEEKKAD
ncbi:MAG: 50S ribosomal protein L9 [Sphaerochaetaceae bacterium]